MNVLTVKKMVLIKEIPMTNKEIMHAYVHAYGNTGSGSNVSYNKDLLFSYNTCMCKKDWTSEGLVYLINNNTYSPTTSKQMSYFWSALPSSSKRFLVDDPCGEHSSNAKIMFDEIIEKYIDMQYTNHKGKKDRLVNEITDDTETLREYMELFSVKFWSRKKADKMMLAGDLGDELNEAREKMIKDDNAKKRKQQREKAKRLAEQQKEAVAVYETIDKPMWIKGELKNIHTPSSLRGVLCRITTAYYRGEKTRIIETSSGAKMDMKEVSRLIQDLLDDKAVPGSTYDGYQFVKFDKEGLTIGCHFITRGEVGRVIKMVAEDSNRSEVTSG